MSISAICQPHEKMMRTGVVYLLVSLLCVVFGAVYERFSHEVYSFWMIYAFVFPLSGGALPFLGLGLCKRNPPGKAACRFYHAGIAALTVGSLLQGALEIYGTTNRLIAVYWWSGAGLVVSGLVLYGAGASLNNRQKISWKTRDDTFDV